MIEIKDESFVFIGEQPCQTRYKQIKEGSFSLYFLSEHTNEKDSIYEVGKDYTIDFESGKIMLTQESRVPNFKNSVLYGKEDFDHRVAHQSNGSFTVYASYESAEEKEPIRYNGFMMKNAVEKLKRTGEINYLVFGDSISTGCEAFKGRAYFDLLKNYLECEYGGKVNIVNVAVSGETTEDGKKRLDKILENDFDLVTIAYGTNDHCKKENTVSDCFTSFTDYKNNIEQFIISFRGKNPLVDIFLIAPFEVNRKWHFHSPSMPVFVEILKMLSKIHGTGLVDIFSSFEEEQKNGKTAEDLFNNDINHPNNYGHILYFERIKKLFEGL